MADHNLKTSDFPDAQVRQTAIEATAQAIRAHELARRAPELVALGQGPANGLAGAKNGRELTYSLPLEDFSAWDEA